MGTWGTGIYSNDMAMDLKDTCQDVFSFYDLEEGNREIFRIYEDVVNQEQPDNEYASFWYALSDWQWKHGMLTEPVKQKTLMLLKKYTGIEEWMESGSKSDVNKRRKVLDTLKLRLQSEQPSLKKPKLQFFKPKPKHKPGTIIVFKATEYVNEWDSTWHICTLLPSYIYASPDISRLPYQDLDLLNAHGMYMAILCVGSHRERYSANIPGLYNDYSTYVWYNYLSKDKPSIEQLNQCGFLPFICCHPDYVDDNGYYQSKDSIAWGYQFMVYGENFVSDKSICFEDKGFDLNEVERFKRLFTRKGYPDELQKRLDLTQMFFDAYSESARMKMLGLEIDDLLDSDIKNPELLSAVEYREYREE